ncbi:MAG: hypothetical protein RR216_04825 [Pseudoflavonifractor sp.]
MERNLMVLATLLALSLGVTACTAEKAPNVTPTNTPAATSPPPVSVRPVETPPPGTVGNTTRHAKPNGADVVRGHVDEFGRAAEGEYQSR